MAKVLVERERIKPYHGDGYGQVRALLNREEPEEATSYVPMRKLHKDQKQLNENLSPLKRFLESKRGQRWDDIYSEMREHVSAGNEVQNHILSHLNNYVELDCVTLDDGNVVRSNGEKLSTYSPYYVDQDGILKQKVKQGRWRDKKKRNKDSIRISHMVYAERINDIWYIVQYKNITKEPTKDVLTNEVVYYENVPAQFKTDILGGANYSIKYTRFVPSYDRVFGTPHKINNSHWNQTPTTKSWIAISKKQMNKKEIKKYVRNNQ